MRLAPHFFAERFAWLRKKFPPATHRSLVLFTLLLPGAPYFAQNYAMAITRVPFWLFFRLALPIAFIRSITGIIFGEWSGDMTPGRITFFVIYTATVMLICGLAFRRLRAQSAKSTTRGKWSEAIRADAITRYDDLLRDEAGGDKDVVDARKRLRGTEGAQRRVALEARLHVPQLLRGESIGNRARRGVKVAAQHHIFIRRNGTKPLRARECLHLEPALLACPAQGAS